MKGYTSEHLRNIIMLGHGGAGKTTVIEAALAATGAVSRMGRVEDGNTVSDYEKTEKEKGYSIQTSIVPVEWNKSKINFLDTPGFFDFVGEVCGSIRAAEAAVIVVDASAGVQVGTEKAWNICKKNGTPRLFLINKTDKENVDVADVVSQLKSKFGTSVATLDDKDALNEAIAETDEDLMEKFFSGEDFTDEEFSKGLSGGIAAGDITIVLEASAIKQEGVKEFLDAILKYVPAPTEHAAYAAEDSKGEQTEVKCDPAGPAAAFVFKTFETRSGKVSLMKLIRGKVSKGLELYNTTTEKVEKLGSISYMRGQNVEEAGDIVAGDIFAATKLAMTKTGDTLCDKSAIVKFPPIDFPQPSLYMAVAAKAKGEDEKVGTGLNRMREEDPSFVVERNSEVSQTLLGGQGEIQIGIITAKLKDRFGVDVDLLDPKVPYRETIKGTADVQGKHKKQSGGAGQYGDVHIKFSPSQEEFEFGEELFGGSVPK